MKIILKARYNLNHNLYIVVFCDPTLFIVTYFSRFIASGQELNYHYSQKVAWTVSMNYVHSGLCFICLVVFFASSLRINQSDGPAKYCITKVFHKSSQEVKYRLFLSIFSCIYSRNQLFYSNNIIIKRHLLSAESSIDVF